MTIEIRELTKRYGQHFTLSVPHLHVASGERLGLVGNNGAGKTTLLRSMLDLIQVDAGDVLYNGESAVQTSQWKKAVGSYLDESFLIDFLTPEEFFFFVGTLYGLSRDATHAALDPFRSFLAPEVFSATPPYIRDLSMGNKKKVGIVGALMVQPQLLILDEPFANLDPGSQIRLKTKLLERSMRDTTLVLSSHDLTHVTEVCDRIVIVHDGIVQLDLHTSEATLDELRAFFAANS